VGSEQVGCGRTGQGDGADQGSPAHQAGADNQRRCGNPRPDALNQDKGRRGGAVELADARYPAQHPIDADVDRAKAKQAVGQPSDQPDAVTNFLKLNRIWHDDLRNRDRNMGRFSAMQAWPYGVQWPSPKL
jgi:hypothetical protein